jgi:hypothetical protein
MKPFLIAFVAAPGVAILSYCFGLNQLDLGTLDLDLTWDDLAGDLWLKR